MANYFSLILLTLLLFPALAIAEDDLGPRFAFPVDCTLGVDCWTINYMDVAPKEDEMSDFMCQSKTTDGHQGTDFAIRSPLEMASGVDVLAAADGKILRVRNGESDTRKTEAEYEAIHKDNKDCGNGVLIDHGSGINTLYCHMKEDSMVVKPGQSVKEGQKIGEIGRSGYAEFPHLHFAIIWEEGYIDPFTGLMEKDGCGKMKQSLWKEPVPYEPYSIFDGGFRGEMPDFEKIKQGDINPQIISSGSEAFVFWIGFYHARKGDELDMSIRGPGGEIFTDRHVVLDENRKRPFFYYIGRSLKDKTLSPGIYTGTATYRRAGFPDKTIRHEVLVR